MSNLLLIEAYLAKITKSQKGSYSKSATNKECSFGNIFNSLITEDLIQTIEKMNAFLIEKFSRKTYKEYLEQYNIQALRRTQKYNKENLKFFLDDLQIETQVYYE